MDLGRVSVSYAKALLEYATNNRVAEIVYSQSNDLIAIIKNSEDFRLLLHTPMVSLSKKIQVVKTLLKDYSPELVSMVILTIKNGREGILENILLVFQRLYREKFNIIKTFVESAWPLETQTKESIIGFLKKTYDKTVESIFIVNPQIIGGFTLTIEDKILDKSVGVELKKLQKKLIGIA